MSVDIPNLVAALVEKYGTQTKLARKLGNGITQPLISRWLRGTDPERENYDRLIALAKADGLLDDVRSEDVAISLPEQMQGPKVKIKGYVGAGSVAHYYAISDEEYEEVDAPAAMTDPAVAVEIRGKSMGPALEGWLVFYKDVRSPVTPDMLNQLCVVGLTDDRILIKLIKRERDGSFTLLSNGADDAVTHAKIEWAALVTDMRRRR
jgi:transcriptional regulator with XRE-family HTH domain